MLRPVMILQAMMNWCWALLLCVVVPSLAPAQTIRLIAGSGTAGFFGDGSLDEAAQFNSPVGLSGDSTGALYVADAGNHRIRRISAVRDSLTTVAGTGVAGYTGDGAAATGAQLDSPRDVFVAGSGTLYVADTGNHVVRRITPAGVISTVAGTGVAGFSGDGAAADSAQLSSPAGVYVTGGVIYIADQGNHRIRAIAAGNIRTYAGTGTAADSGDGGRAVAAALSSPADVYADTAGNLYIADSGNHKIRVIAASDSTISTVAGTGVSGFGGDGGLAVNAQLSFPRSVFVDTAGNVYITDRFNHRLRRVSPSGVMTTLAGTGALGYGGDSPAANRSRLASPSGVWLHNQNIYITDTENHRIRLIDDDNVAGLSGASTAAPGRLTTLLRIAFTGDGQTGVKGVTATVSDLSTTTGLTIDDFQSFHLYESADSLLSADDLLLGTRAARDVTLGTAFDIQASPTSVPAADSRRHYILAARFSSTAVEGHALRLGFATGGLSTSIGGHGRKVAAVDTDRITLDVVATRLVFTTGPDGVISGNPLLQQPTVAAVDDSGLVDGDFTDVVTLSLTGGSAGTLLQTSATAVAGVANFAGVTYVATADGETFQIVADDASGGAEGDLPAVVSSTLTANAANDAPTVVALAFTIDEDDSLRVPIGAMVQDVDDSLSALTIDFSSAHTDAYLDGTDLILRPQADYFGPDTLLIVATDPFGASASDLAILTIKAVNDRPVLEAPPLTTIAEDDTLLIDLTALARDEETPFADLNWIFVSSTGLSTAFDAEAGILRSWTAPDSSGLFSLQISVIDGDLATTSRTDTIAITSVNDVPSLILPDTLLARGESLSLDLSSFSADADHDIRDLDFRVDGTLGLLASIDGTGLSVTALPSFSGAAWAAVTVTDPLGAATMDTLQIAVFTANPQAPVIASLPALAVETRDTLTLDLTPYVRDLDDPLDVLTVTVTSDGGGSFSTDSLRVVFVADSTAGPVTALVTVTDPGGEAGSAGLQIDVTPPPPLLSNFPHTLEIELSGIQLFLDAFVTGAPPEQVAWLAQASDDLVVVLDAGQRTVRVAPVDGSRQGGDIIFTATTPDRSVAETLAVSIANVVPIVDFPDLSLHAGESAQLLLDEFVVDDEDVARLDWSALALEPGLQVALNTAARAMALTANSDAGGDIAVALAATDQQGAVGRDTLVVTIATQDPGGDTTGVDPGGDTTAVDAGGDTTTVDGGGDTTAVDAGGDTTAVDAGDVNTAPQLGPFPVLSLFAGVDSTLRLDELAEDDDPLAELVWSADPGTGLETRIDTSSRQLRIVSREGFSGTTSVRLTATDRFGASGSGSLLVEVSRRIADPEPGDFGRDGSIDLDDFFLFADHLGLTRFHAGWDPIFDLNDDGRIDFDDFFLFVDIYNAARLAP